MPPPARPDHLIGHESRLPQEGGPRGRWRRVSTLPARWGDALARLPVQPAVSVRLLELTRNPAVTVQQVAGLVELDPALTARVVRLANVPYRGLRTPVTTARRAVVLLGVSTVRALVAS